MKGCYKENKQTYLNNRKHSKKRGKPMTCIIGMYCDKRKNAIIISDSREMQGYDFILKRKIYKINENVVYAGSGYTGMSIELRDNVENRMRIEGITDNSETIKTIGDEMFKLRTYYKHPDAPRFSQDEVLINAILGTYIQNKPKLYCLHENGWAEPTEEKFRAVGDGWRFANQILTSLYREDLTVKQAIQLGIHCMVQISRLDSVVDDNPQVAILQNNEINIMNIRNGEFIMEHPDLMEMKNKINGIEDYRTKVFRLMMSNDDILKTEFKSLIEKYKDQD